MRLLLLLFVVSCVACTDEVFAPPVDHRSPLPEPDPRFYDIVSPDVVIQPGEEKMLCYHVRTTEPLAVRGLATRQGPNGHHVAMFTTDDPQPHGTLEDCTDSEANAKLSWFILAFEPLPDGYAIDVPEGMPIVMQFHYINPTDEPVLVRDYARMKRAEPAAVTTWVSTLITQDLQLAIAPGESTVSWECTLERPVDLMIVTGHMHELGARIDIELGGAPLYKVDPWKAEYRDAAPTTSYYGAPKPIAAGTTIKTTCTYRNTSDRTVGFPEEMCMLFAYVGGSRAPLQCLP